MQHIGSPTGIIMWPIATSLLLYQQKL